MKYPEFELITIQEGETLPEHCYRCDRTSESVVKISEKIESFKVPVILRLLSHVVLVVFFPIRLLSSAIKADQDQTEIDRNEISIRVPVCKFCKSYGPAKVLRFDFNNFCADLEVCREFKQRVISSRTPTILSGKKQWKPRHRSSD